MADTVRRFPDDPEVRLLAGRLRIRDHQAEGPNVACAAHLVRCKTLEICRPEYEVVVRGLEHASCASADVSPSFALFGAGPATSASTGTRTVVFQGQTYALEATALLGAADIEGAVETSQQTGWVAFNNLLAGNDYTKVVHVFVAPAVTTRSAAAHHVLALHKASIIVMQGGNAVETFPAEDGAWTSDLAPFVTMWKTPIATVCASVVRSPLPPGL